MVNSSLKLIETRHPHKDCMAQYERLIGIDAHKQELLHSLQLLLDRQSIQKWKREFHPKGLPFLDLGVQASPLIVLSGEVGCGKTALAGTIATPLAIIMGGITIHAFETPSDIRGGGHVGELSQRITSAFTQAKAQLSNGKYGLLIIDEADDLATSRSQNQAHHEDRAGVNVLIKEIDQIEKDKINLAVILITNRALALDPAVLRRASLNLVFNRPDADVLRALFDFVLENVKVKAEDMKHIVNACMQKKIPYSFSDVTRRVARQSLIMAWQTKQPLSAEIILDIISVTEPSPLIQ